MKIINDTLECFFKMLDIWFGQGDGVSILVISLLLVIIGFFCAGLFKKRKAKLIAVFSLLSVAILCNATYQSSDMMGVIFGSLVFGITTMLFIGLIVRFILMSFFTK